MRPESSTVIFRDDLAAIANEYDERTAATRFIGRRVAPLAPVDKMVGEYPIMNRENFTKPARTERAQSGAYNRITGEFGKGTYTCEEHGLEHPIDDRRRARYAHLFDAESAATRILRFQLLLNHERRIYSLISGIGWTNHDVATAWSSATTAVPLDDIQSGVEAIQDACGAANDEIRLVIPRADYRELLRTTQVKEKVLAGFTGLPPAQMKPQQLAALLEIGGVLRAAASYDTKEEGVAETHGQIWTAGVMWLLVCCNENDGLDMPSAARTIIWTAGAPALPVVETYRDDTVRADIVRARDDTDEVAISDANVFGYQITNT